MNRKKLEAELVEGTLLSVLLPLAERGVLTAEIASDPEKSAVCLRKHLKYAVRKMKMGVAVEETFLTEAVTCWRRGERMVGVVLFATAVEQWLNFVLRILAQSKGYSDEMGTNIVKTHNFDAKLTWLFLMLSGEKLPRRYLPKLKRIIEIRNSVVHYKALTAHPDSDTDSHSVICRELEKLKGMQLERIYRGFQSATWEIALRCYPALKIAMDARACVLDQRKQTA